MIGLLPPEVAHAAYQTDLPDVVSRIRGASDTMDDGPHKLESLFTF